LSLKAMARSIASLLFASVCGSSESSLPDCASSYTSLTTGDVCNIAWTSLMTGQHRVMPTESSVGHAWAIHQMHAHFETEKDATKWLGKNEFPVILHNANFYLTDRHHHMVAMLLSGHMENLSVNLKVVCDFRDVSAAAFWTEMVDNKYALAYDWSDETPEALPGLVDFTKMPTSWDISSFGDNQWRSMAGFASNDKWTGWIAEERCYVKECQYFIDFTWAYLFTESATKKNDNWPVDANISPDEFLQRLRSMPRQPSVEGHNETAWHTLAGELLPLCHSTPVQNYTLPQFFPSGTLSGWSTVPLPQDPDCLPSVCGAAALVV